MRNKVSFVRKSDDKELCSFYIEDKCNADRVHTLFCTFGVGISAVTCGDDNLGYWNIPVTLQARLMKCFGWNNPHNTLLKKEVRWYR